jgi:hypothetical protein
MNASFQLERGGTGDPPVSSGHWPDEMATRIAAQGGFDFVRGFHFAPRFDFRVFRGYGVFSKWVERATRPSRLATRQPEWPDASCFSNAPGSEKRVSPFRPASRRTAPASGLGHPKPF